MNNDIFSMDLTRTLPPALKQDKTMQALSQVIAGELQENARMICNNIIYARIDELPEKLLDILAYDLHIDWYDYDYPVEVKRDLIKTSVKVHKKLGTVYAVETALGALHPRSEIEEWFDYGGEPFYFRIVLDVSQSRVRADSSKIIRTVKMYKRLTAHIEGLYYQCGVVIEVAARTEYFRFRSKAAGRVLAGTEPYRNVRGGIGNRGIEIEADAAGGIFQSTQAGTEPYRNRVFRKKDSDIEADAGAERNRFRAAAAGQTTAGTEPQRNVSVKYAEAGIEEETDTEQYKYRVEAAGQNQAGETPYRNISGGAGESRVEMEDNAAGFLYTAAAAGTEPYRDKKGGKGEDEMQISAETEPYQFASTAAGTEPGRTRKGTPQGSGIEQTAAGEAHAYRTAYCGAKGLSRKNK